MTLVLDRPLVRDAAKPRHDRKVMTPVSSMVPANPGSEPKGSAAVAEESVEQ
ncbi:MAG: hypothetical protein QOH56_952, partial [Pseudonocardiales bacterium]|nr:hypothetical protein [Pseudonocardiales bacterium]